MTLQDVSLYSPFCPFTCTDGNNRSLLLQFLLFEIFHAIDIDTPSEELLTKEPRLFPCDWSMSTGPLNKLKEHAEFLEYAFPSKLREIAEIKQAFDQVVTLDDLKHSLPLFQNFIEDCKDDENLLFFLLKHQEHCHIILSNWDIDWMQTTLQKRYQDRGFHNLIPQIDELIEKLKTC